jgi:hypothetical protein
VSSVGIEIVVPEGRLPVDPRRRDQVLHDYFSDRVVDSRQEPDGRWRVTVKPAPTADCYVDPRLDDGLCWWDAKASVTDIPYAFRGDNGIFVALSDAWTLLSWSQWLATLAAPPEHVTIVHLDDHDDLMSPRLAHRAGGFTDLLTGAEVDLTKPATVHDAITSGAIGMGSFVAPLLHSLPSVDIRHLCDTRYATLRAHEHRIHRVDATDALLQPGIARPAVALSPIASSDVPCGQIVGNYRASDDVADLFGDIADHPILLHIDLDFFNNRFDGDSDWRDRVNRHDPSIERIYHRIEVVVAALRRLRGRIVDVTIGISAGFFPAEFWQPVNDVLVRELAARRDPVDNPHL